MAPISDARHRANEKYNAKAYDTILVRVKKGQKDKIKAHAISSGKSINDYIVTAIEVQMNNTSPIDMDDQ